MEGITSTLTSQPSTSVVTPTYKAAKKPLLTRPSSAAHLHKVSTIKDKVTHIEQSLNEVKENLKHNQNLHSERQAELSLKRDF